MWRPFCLGAGCGIWHVAPMSRWFSPKSWPPENHLDMIANLPPYHSPKRGEITVRDDKCNGPWLPPSAGEEGYESKRCMNAQLPQNPLLRAHTWGWTTMFPFLVGPPLLPLGLGVGGWWGRGLRGVRVFSWLWFWLLFGRSGEQNGLLPLCSSPTRTHKDSPQQPKTRHSSNGWRFGSKMQEWAGLKRSSPKAKPAGRTLSCSSGRCHLQQPCVQDRERRD